MAVRSKGCLSNKTALAMIFKLTEAAEKSWRRLDGHNQFPKIILGVSSPTESKLSDRKLNPLPPDPDHHQLSAIARRALPQEVDLMPQYQDFSFKPSLRFEAVAQSADENEGSCDHSAIMF
jgi:hypothetical protein